MAEKRKKSQPDASYIVQDDPSARWLVAEKSPHVYDLEDRTFAFAQRTRLFVKRVPTTLANIEDCKQLIRSSGSVGANYIEANEALSKKDFLLRIKISRKKAKESRYWLRLIDLDSSPQLENNRSELVQEAHELMNILSAIYRRSQPGS